MLEDLKSANGTYRNEERVDRVRLNDGDRIRIGSTELRFELVEGPEEIQLEDPGAEDSRYAILFTGGERSGERMPIAARLTLGRRGNNDVKLNDSKVSGAHAELCVEEGRPVLRDLGSTNGTFLEGKRIDEIPLDHGDRVSIGDNEFTLLDTTRPEPAPRESFIPEAEQTIVDVPKVKVVQDVSHTKQSPLALIGSLLLIGAIVGGGAYYYLLQQRGSAVAEAPPPEPGNMLGASWSFEASEDGEDATSTWALAAEEHGAAFEVESAARSGSQCLAAAIDGAPAVASMLAPLSTTGRTYAISGYARCDGDAVALIVARFGDADDPEGDVTIPVGSTDASDWTAIEAEVVPPDGADQLRLQLVAAGGSGEVRFDDLSVVEGAMASGSPVEINQFEFGRSGESILIRRGGARVMAIGGTEFTTPDGVVHDAGRFVADGRILLAGGNDAAYGSSFEAGENGATWTLTWSGVPADGADQATLPITLLPPLSDVAVGLLRDGRLEPYRESFEVTDVDGLILGEGAARMRIRLTPSVVAVGRPGGGRFELGLRPGVGAGGLEIACQVDFVAEKTQAASLLNEARDIEADGRLGEALAVLDRIANEFPFDEPTLAEAENRRAQILRERDRLAKELRETSERAEFLQSPTAFRAAEELAEAAATSFAGTEWADDFKARRDALAQDRETRLRDAEERQAALLLQRVETALAQVPPHDQVAQNVAHYLEARYPWSEAARIAAEKVGN